VKRRRVSVAAILVVVISTLATSAEAKPANPLMKFKGDAFNAVATSGSKVVAAGAAQTCRWSQGDCGYYFAPRAPLVARYTQSGKLDKSFNGKGFRLLDHEAAYNAIIGVVVRPDRSLLIAYRTASSIKLISLTRSGKLDRGFGESGGTEFPLTLFNPASRGLVALDDGRTVIPGQSSSGEFGTLVIDANGEVDTGFGDGGVATVGPPVGPLEGYTSAVAVQRGRGILALGDTIPHPGAHAMTAARFKFDGSLDPTFGTDGITRFDLLSSAQIGLSARGIVPFGEEGIAAACDVYGVHALDPDGSYPGSLFENSPDQSLQVPCIGLADAVRVSDGLVAAGTIYDDNYKDGWPHPWVRQFDRTESAKLGPAEPRRTLPGGYRGFNSAVAAYGEGFVVAGSLLSDRCQPPWRPGGTRCQAATLTRLTEDGRDTSFGRDGIATLRKGVVCRGQGRCQ